jgi:type IV secretory pathway protease TraF
VVSVAGEQVVVWGDNRASSTDSRVFGPVDRGALVGRAVYRYFPPDRTGRLR